VLDRTPSERAAEAPPLSELLDRLYRAPLKRLFMRREGSVADAEDFVQDVFARLIERPPDHRYEKPRAYVFAVAVNLLRDRARRERRQAGVVARTAAPAALELARCEEADAESVLIQKDELRRLMEALDEMNARTRSIFILCRFQGVPQKEIAGKLGITVSAVEKQVSKALVQLATRLER
jgi:RNA polymerase sigma-70 factor (ECF subfamily)